MVLGTRAGARFCTCSGRTLGRRGFSSSSSWRRRGTLASFPETSSPELDALITRFRDTAFIPNHLNRAYREMIFRPTQHVYLTGEEPVTVSLPIRPAVPGQILPRPAAASVEGNIAQSPSAADTTARANSKVPRAKAPPVHPRKKAPPSKETFTLSPLLVQKDLPNTRRSYIQLLGLMHEPADFALVPAFLHELRIAGLPVTPTMLAKTARRGAELDRVDVVLHLFQSISSIGIPLNHPEIVQQVMLAIVRHAATDQWSQARLDGAIAFADAVLVMLRDPRHQVMERGAPALDSASLPLVWGTSMALAAVRELKYGAREITAQRTHSLRTLAESFLSRLDLATFADPAPSPTSSSDSTSAPISDNISEQAPEGSWGQYNAFLAAWAPTVYGTKHTIAALGPQDPMGMKLQLALPAMESTLATAEQMVRAHHDARDRELKMSEKSDGEVESQSEERVPIGLKILSLMEAAQ